LEHTQEIQQSPGSLGIDADMGRELVALNTSDTDPEFPYYDSVPYCKHFRVRVFSLYMLGLNLLL